MANTPLLEQQVLSFNIFQKWGQFHPFTCPGDFPCCKNQRELIATKEGQIVCQCGKYTQGWCHDFMVNIQEPPVKNVLAHRLWKKNVEPYLAKLKEENDNL